MIKNINAAPPAKTDGKPGASRDRIRQDKFSTTLHLPCFMPREEETPKA